MEGIALQKAILYIHGKGGTPKEAELYQALFPEYSIFGLDYQGATPWETKREILSAYETYRTQYASILLLANSIGAFFGMNALSGRPIEKALFISPIVDMEKLICDLMIRAGVTEEDLCEKQEIETPFGETLSWRYLCYVRENPIIWKIPTAVLYAEKDNLTSYATVSAFAKKANADLTVLKDGEHWFHTDAQIAFLKNWLQHILKKQ